MPCSRSQLVCGPPFAQVQLLLRFLGTPAGAVAVNATITIPTADRAAIIGLPGLVDATEVRSCCKPGWGCTRAVAVSNMLLKSRGLLQF